MLYNRAMGSLTNRSSRARVGTKVATKMLVAPRDQEQSRRKRVFSRRWNKARWSGTILIWFQITKTDTQSMTWTTLRSGKKRSRRFKRERANMLNQTLICKAFLTLPAKRNLAQAGTISTETPLFQSQTRTPMLMILTIKTTELAGTISILPMTMMVMRNRP